MIQENNIQELDQMKQQLEMLKKKLETQNIINEKIIRSAMKSKLGNINRMGRFFFIMGSSHIWGAQCGSAAAHL